MFFGMTSFLLDKLAGLMVYQTMRMPAIPRSKMSNLVRNEIAELS
jgi:hypothetical protein